MNEIIETPKTAAGGIDLGPRTFEQALQFADYLADCDLVPKDFRGKPANCVVAMQWGAELGLKPMQALQNIAVINGRPALWGDAVIGLVRASPLCEWIVETDDGSTSTCKVKRRGEPEQARTFSDDDAKAAGLLGKQGPWTQYKKRMRQMRARAFALRDVFPDVLRGLPIAEEVMDIPTERHMGAADEVKTAGTPTPPAQPTWPDDAFVAQFGRWQKAVQAGLKTVDDIVTLAKSKGALTEAQEAQIRGIKKADAADATPTTKAPEADPFVTEMEAAERQGDAQ